MSRPRFDCDCCGLCCRNIGGIPQLSQFDRGDGVCCHLSDENLCKIYESRPEVCSVDRMYSRFAPSMSKASYYEMMSRSCQFLKQHEFEMRSGVMTQDELLELTRNVPSESLARFADEFGVVVSRESGSL